MRPLRNCWKPGVRGWLVQRVSAVVMLACFCVFMGLWWLQPGGYLGWKNLLESPAGKGVLLLFFFSLFAHAWLGMRHVLGDYVRHPRRRAGLRRLVQAGLAGYAVWIVFILF